MTLGSICFVERQTLERVELLALDGITRPGEQLLKL